MDIYQDCPVVCNADYELRMVEDGDAGALLKVYSDEAAVPLFNGDNCHGDDFHYTTLERMQEAIRFWRWSYDQRYFVRWSVVDRRRGETVGTIELFRREESDTYGGHGILRLDLRSDHEHMYCIQSILGLIVEPSYEWFGFEKLSTKAIPQAAGRRIALAAMGFVPNETKLIGHDGTVYGDYWTK